MHTTASDLFPDGFPDNKPECLTDREWDVLVHRFRDGRTLRETGCALGVTRSTIRQHEVKAAMKLHVPPETRAMMRADYLAGTISQHACVTKYNLDKHVVSCLLWGLARQRTPRATGEGQMQRNVANVFRDGWPDKRPDCLNERDWLVLCLRFRDGLSCDAVGERYGVTRERIRQIERKASKRLIASSQA